MKLITEILLNCKQRFLLIGTENDMARPYSMGRPQVIHNISSGLYNLKVRYEQHIGL